MARSKPINANTPSWTDSRVRVRFILRGGEQELTFAQTFMAYDLRVVSRRPSACRQADGEAEAKEVGLGWVAYLWRDENVLDPVARCRLYLVTSWWKIRLALRAC